MNELSDEVRIRPVVDEDVLHLPLFSIYRRIMCSDIIINMKGVHVGGKKYNNRRYADDTASLAGNEKTISKLNEVGKQFGMKINIKKIKAMFVSKMPVFTQNKYFL